MPLFSPKTMVERCSSGSISTFAANRARMSVDHGLAETVFGEEQEVLGAATDDDERRDHAPSA